MLLTLLCLLDFTRKFEVRVRLTARLTGRNDLVMFCFHASNAFEPSLILPDILKFRVRLMARFTDRNDLVMFCSHDFDDSIKMFEV